MKKLILSVKYSAGELKSVITISVTGMLVAVGIVLSFFTLPISNVLHIGFSFLPLAVSGMLYGPVIGGITGVITDVLEYFIRPDGPFFPGFTLNALLSGAIYGFFLYRKPVTVKRVIAVSALITVLINLLLNPLWLSILYGNAYIVLLTGRLLKNLIMFPVNTALLASVLKIVEKSGIRNRAHG